MFSKLALIMFIAGVTVCLIPAASPVISSSANAAEIRPRRNDETVQTLTGKCENRSPVINNKGTIVWQGFCSGRNYVFLFKDGKTTRLTKDAYQGLSPRLNLKGEVIWIHLKKAVIDTQGNFLNKIAHYKNGKVTIIDGSENGSRPEINDKGAVIWQGLGQKKDHKGRFRYINTIMLNESGKTRNLEVDTVAAKTPDINNQGIIVLSRWVDKADPTEKKVAHGYTGVFEIFLQGGDKGKFLTDSKTYQNNKNPMINDKGMIVWHGQIKGKTAEIYLYDGKKTKRLTKNKLKDTMPVINNNGEVVWQGRRSGGDEIFYYDGSTVRQITDNFYDDREPWINDNGVIVWAAMIGDEFQIQKMSIR
jgi:hypothetical protein